MQIISNTNIDVLAKQLLEDILTKENYNESSGKGSFLTGGNIIICESPGLQEYIKKKCVDEHGGIWAGLSFKPLAGFLMRCSYSLAPKELKKDDKENVFDANNLVWAIYRLLKGKQKIFSFASELASLFEAYQIYRGEIINKWNSGKTYLIKDADENFKNNEEFQRKLWTELKRANNDEQDIYQMYKYLETELKSDKTEKKFIPKRVFIFAPLSIAPVHYSALSHLSDAGCKINLYLLQISTEYIGTHLSDKKIARKRKEAWRNNKILDKNLYWDFGNRLIANLGRCAQVLYEQLGENNFEYINEQINAETLLGKIQANIINDSNEEIIAEKDNSLTFSNCFSSLREIEVLSDYILNLFDNNKSLTAEDIAIVSPNIENYSTAIETVFSRYNIPYRIADRDIKKYDKTVQLSNMLFTLIGSRYEAPEIIDLFEYSRYVQKKKFEPNDRELLEKWLDENAVRYGIKRSAPKPDYSFESGLEQLAAGFFMISDNGFSDNGEYCYPDIEGNSACILGDLADFLHAIEIFDIESAKEQSIENWDVFFKDNLQIFFGEDTEDFNEDSDTPYQKIINAWDSLKKEMLIGFGQKNECVNFTSIKTALISKIEEKAKSFYTLNGRISCSNFETIRAVPHKIICCVGMNSREFPRQLMAREISLLQKYKQGDKDPANEDRLIFLETILNAREKLYISWIGQSEKSAEEIEPSSVVTILLKNLEEQYGINKQEQSETGNFTIKYPLQPFSKKTKKSYDNRWYFNRSTIKDNIWKWEISADKNNEKGNINNLFMILSDAPKYFLRTVCNIKLPGSINLLNDTEPFTIEKGLEEWMLGDLILHNDNYINEIKIQKLKGRLPSGNFADNIINKKIDYIKGMLAKIDPDIKTLFITTSKDKGHFRLKHWLQHLDYNLVYECYETEVILDEIKIRLPGISRSFAEKEVCKLWDMTNRLKIKLLPIFPNAAWEYFISDNNVTTAEKWIFGNSYNSLYIQMAIKKAESFADLGIENEFIECSNILFGNYNGENIKI